MIKIENDNFLLNSNILNKELQFIQFSLGAATIENLYSNVITSKYPMRFCIFKPQDTITFSIIEKEIAGKNYDVCRYMLSHDKFETFYKLNNFYLFGKIVGTYDEFNRLDHLCFGENFDEIWQERFDYFVENLSNGLNTHHKLYTRIKDNYELPWNYSADDLTTLCSDCHSKVHENNETPIYDEFNRKLNTEKCSKCKGIGYINNYFYHDDEVCSGCDGTGYSKILYPI